MGLIPEPYLPFTALILWEVFSEFPNSKFTINLKNG